MASDHGYLTHCHSLRCTRTQSGGPHTARRLSGIHRGEPCCFRFLPGGPQHIPARARAALSSRACSIRTSAHFRAQPCVSCRDSRYAIAATFSFGGPILSHVPLANTLAKYSGPSCSHLRACSNPPFWFHPPYPQGTVRIWNLLDGSCYRRMKGHMVRLPATLTRTASAERASSALRLW